jgi:hypothetical protein
MCAGKPGVTIKMLFSSATLDELINDDEPTYQYQLLLDQWVLKSRRTDDKSLGQNALRRPC